MTREQFICALSDSYDNNVAISKAKNADYANDSDPFANFRKIEELSNGLISTEAGILVRMSDKLTRVTNLVLSKREAAVVDESIADTLSDLANYAMILKVYIEQKKTTGKTAMQQEAEKF